MNRNIVVVGASLGGVAALLQLVAGLQRPFPAALLIVLHVGPMRSELPHLLRARTSLDVAHAIDGEPLEPDRIYVAPPDRHLVIDGDNVALTRGPKEHHTRPAIDPLFRSAALAHGPRVVGVVLTGALDDGVAGLQVVKACGGIAVVQDPHDADCPEMPSHALHHVDVDHCLPLSEIPELLSALVRQHVPPAVPTPLTPKPEVAMQEHEITRRQHGNAGRLDTIGAPSGFTCPDCHGALWALRGPQPARYRCHTGHAYSLLSLQHTLQETTEEALWSAIRALQEHAMLLERVPLGADAPADAEARVRALRDKVDRLRAIAET